MVWVREIWVRGCLLRGFWHLFGFDLSDLFLLHGLLFLRVSVWFSSSYFLVWVSSSSFGLLFFFMFLFGFLLCGFVWSLYGSRVFKARVPSIKLNFIILDLAQQNWVSHTQDVILLNSFENMLTKEIVWVLVLFWKKIPIKGGIGPIFDHTEIGMSIFPHPTPPRPRPAQLLRVIIVNFSYPKTVLFKQTYQY